MRYGALLALVAILFTLVSPFSLRLPDADDGPPAVVTLNPCHQGQPALGGGSDMPAACPGVFFLPHPPLSPEPVPVIQAGPVSLAFPPEPAPPKA